MLHNDVHWFTSLDHLMRTSHSLPNISKTCLSTCRSRYGSKPLWQYWVVGVMWWLWKNVCEKCAEQTHSRVSLSGLGGREGLFCLFFRCYILLIYSVLQMTLESRFQNFVCSFVLTCDLCHTWSIVPNCFDANWGGSKDGPSRKLATSEWDMSSATKLCDEVTHWHQPRFVDIRRY